MNRVVLAFALVLAAGSAASANSVAYDHMTGVPSTNWSIPSSTGTPAGTGNRQMGMVVNLAGSGNQITGFDLGLVNVTGAPINNAPGTLARLRYWVWDTYTPGASTTTAAFSNLAGTGTVDFNLGGLTSPFANNTILFISTGASGGVGFPPLAGPTPGAPTFAPINIVDSQVAISFAWELSTNGGASFSPTNGLTSLITGNTGAPAPTVGTNALAGPNFGYFRSVNQSTLDNNGNFAQASSRQIGVNSGVVMRVFTIPAPGAAAVLALGGLVAVRRRRA